MELIQQQLFKDLDEQIKKWPRINSKTFTRVLILSRSKKFYSIKTRNDSLKKVSKLENPICLF